MATLPQMLPELTDQDRLAVVDLVRGVLGEEKSARRAEVKAAWQQRAFKNGIQHMWWDDRGHTWLLPQASGQQLPSYMGVYNIYTPHWRSFLSILSQNPPGVNFQPDDLSQSRDVIAANYAEKARHRVDRLVHMKDRQAETASYFCTDGRCVHRIWTDAKGELKIGVFGVLETKLPIYTRQMTRWSYAVISEEIDQWEAKEEWPDFADEIEADDTTSADSSYERIARLNVIPARRGGFADAVKSLVTLHTAWIRPSRYRKTSKETEQILRMLYPEGFRVSIIGDTVLEIVAERIEDALSIQWPSPGQGQSRPSLLADVVPLQKAFNDALNMLREHIDFSIPATWVDQEAVDIEAVNSQRSAPGMVHPITVPKGASINDLVMQEQVSQLPPELVGNIDRILQLAQFTSGDLPSLFGEGTPDSETATGQKMLSDQAKGQLSPAWSGMQWIMAGTYSLGVRKLADMDHQAGRMSMAVKVNGLNSKFNPVDILNGNWGCYPDTDSSFPETTADKRAAVQIFFTQMGDAGASLVQLPDNQMLLKNLAGVSDLYLPFADARNKAQRDIEQLLQEAPVPDQEQMPQYQQQVMQAQAMGQAPPPPPMTCSIAIDPDWDMHQPIIDKVTEFLNSQKSYEEDQQGNTQGLENVKLYGQAHKKALAAQQQPTPGKPPNISINIPVQDPRTQAKLLNFEIPGLGADPEDLAEAMVPDLQNQAADTQNKAAGAQHKAVLAAKEAVAPAKDFETPTPDKSVPKE